MVSIGPVSGLEKLISNECVLPSDDLSAVMATALTTDPAQHSAVNLLRILLQLLQSCIFTTFGGSMYVLVVFLITGYGRVWRDSLRKLDLHQYMSSSSSSPSSPPPSSSTSTSASSSLNINSDDLNNEIELEVYQ